MKEKATIKIVGRPNAVRKISDCLRQTFGCAFSFPKTGDVDPTVMVVYSTTEVEVGDIVASAEVGDE